MLIINSCKKSLTQIKNTEEKKTTLSIASAQTDAFVEESGCSAVLRQNQSSKRIQLRRPNTMVVKRRISFLMGCSECGKEIEYFKRVQKVNRPNAT